MYDIFCCLLLYSDGVCMTFYEQFFMRVLLIVSDLVGRNFAAIYTRISFYPIDSRKAYMS